MESDGAHPCVARISEHIAHVVEQDEAYRIAKVGKYRRWQAQLGIVDQRSCSADGKARLRIARSGGIDGKTAHRRGPAGVETLRQGKQFGVAAAEGTLLSIACIARQHEAVLAETVKAGTGQIEAVEVGLRSKRRGRHK